MKTQAKKIPRGWKEVKLSEIEGDNYIYLGRGKVISKNDLKNKPGNFPVYSSSAKGDGRFGEYGDFVFDEELVTWSIDGGGRFFYRYKHKFSVTNVCGYLRVNNLKKIHTKYLFYALDEEWKKKKFDYVAKAHPSVIREAYSLSLPPLPEQKEIAKVLSAVDDCIELTQEVIDATEQLKVGLMQKLFEKKKRWKNMKLGNVCKIERGSTITKNQTTLGNIPVIAGGQKPAYYHNKANRIAPVITISGSGAYAGFVSFFQEPIYASDCSTIQQIDCKEVDIKFIYFFLKWRQKKIYGMQSGAAQPHVYSRDLKEIQVPLPPLPEQKRIADILSSVDEKITLNREKKEKLDILKKGLMQDLLSGKKRIRV